VKATVNTTAFVTTVTSTYKDDAGHSKSHIKLDDSNAWSAGALDTNQKVVVSAQTLQHFVAVTTQGRHDTDQWVLTYKVEYSKDGVNWFPYNNGQAFTANTNRDSKVTYEFNPPILAKKIAINPLTWSTYISMRLEVYVDPTFVPQNEYSIIPSSRILGVWRDHDQHAVDVSRYVIKQDNNTNVANDTINYPVIAWLTPTSFVAKYAENTYIHYIDEATQTLMKVQLNAADPTNPRVFFGYPQTALNKSTYTLGF
jgi:hypothetical protein